MSEMKKAFNIPEDTETRVWNKYMSNSKELLNNMECTVQEAGLYQGQVQETIMFIQMEGKDVKEVILFKFHKISYTEAKK